MTESAEISVSAAYSAVAAEYYDADLHPTCANFRWASDRLLDHLLPHPPGLSKCDVGAGDSALAAWLERNSCPILGLMLVDNSPEMLTHSRRWIDAGATAMRADATELPIESGSVDLLVASLADPFDDHEWWLEVARVLSTGGVGLVTLPALAWAERFRGAAGEPSDSARFVTKAGLSVDVPSHIRSRAAEIELITHSDLRVIAEGEIARAEIPRPVSPKLELLEPTDAVVVAYLVAST